MTMIPLKRKLTPRETLIAAAALGVILVYLSVQFAFKPVKAREAWLDGEIVRQLKFLKKNNGVLQTEQQMRKQHEGFFAPFSQRNSEEEEMSTLLSQLQSLASQSNLNISEIKPQVSRRKEFYKFLSVTLSLEGSFVDIVGFLQKLQVPTYHLYVDELLLESRVTQKPVVYCRINVSRLLIPAGL